MHEAQSFQPTHDYHTAVPTHTNRLMSEHSTIKSTRLALRTRPRRFRKKKKVRSERSFSSQGCDRIRAGLRGSDSRVSFSSLIFPLAPFVRVRIHLFSVEFVLPTVVVVLVAFFPSRRIACCVTTDCIAVYDGGVYCPGRCMSHPWSNTNCGDEVLLIPQKTPDLSPGHVVLRTLCGVMPHNRYDTPKIYAPPKYQDGNANNLPVCRSWSISILHVGPDQHDLTKA